jgi:hypothetical protein
MRDGIGIFRWQAVTPTMTNAGLIRDFRVVKLVELDKIQELPRVTPEQRRSALAARAPGYNTRVA